MAKAKGAIGAGGNRGKTYKKRTSIGKSHFSKPKNKHQKRNWKKYRGQGK